MKIFERNSISLLACIMQTDLCKSTENPSNELEAVDHSIMTAPVLMKFYSGVVGQIVMECQKCNSSVFLMNYLKEMNKNIQCPRCMYPYTPSSILNDMVFAFDDTIYQSGGISLAEYQSILKIFDMKLNLDFIAYYFQVMSPIKQWKENEFCDKLVNFFNSSESAKCPIKTNDIKRYFSRKQMKPDINDNLAVILDIHSELAEIPANLFLEQHYESKQEDMRIRTFMHDMFEYLIRLPKSYPLAKRGCFQLIFSYFCGKRRVSVDKVNGLVAGLEENNLIHERLLLEEIYFSISGLIKTTDIILVMEIFSGTPYKTEDSDTLRRLNKDPILKHHPFTQLLESLHFKAAFPDYDRNNDLDYYAKLAVCDTAFNMRDFGEYALSCEDSERKARWHDIWKTVGFSVWEDKIKQTMAKMVVSELFAEILIFSPDEFVLYLIATKTLDNYEWYKPLQEDLEKDLLQNDTFSISILKEMKDLHKSLQKRLSKLKKKLADKAAKDYPNVTTLLLE
ncbi:hypothetical protein ENBRE01_1167 [Enteropsectra breve]|nr:hypothetical protein ENBRE01_1167 [Enteropsectra breve]